MDDSQLLRYARHILLDELGIEGQQRICAGHVLLVGAGGLGAAAAMYLAAAGVGTLTLVDADTVDLTNLQRQIVHTTARVGQTKVHSAAETLHALNPLVQVNAHVLRATPDWLDQTLPAVDVVLDCSDNFETRHAINAACVRHNKPLVSGAAVRYDGQLGVYDPRDVHSPCYACIFPPQHALEEVSCATLGVFAPLVGIMGSMQAAEALKLLSGAGVALVGRLLMLDARSMDWSDIRLARDPACPVCATHHAPYADHGHHAT